MQGSDFSAARDQTTAFSICAIPGVAVGAAGAKTIAPVSGGQIYGSSLFSVDEGCK